MLSCAVVHFKRFYIFSNKNNRISNTNRWSTVIEENENYLKSYESISKDLKYLTNSRSRLKIIATLYENSKSMKDLTEDTGLSYSSVSGTMHKLELENYVYRQSSKYHLTNSMKMQIENILELYKESLVNKGSLYFFNYL